MHREIIAAKRRARTDDPPLQIVLFSATFPDRVMTFAHKFAPDANQLRLREEELNIAGIRQYYLDCVGNTDKYDVLVNFYGLLTISSSIIFCKVRSRQYTSAKCLLNLCLEPSYSR